jgi:hypothetical protein
MRNENEWESKLKVKQSIEKETKKNDISELLAGVDFEIMMDSIDSKARETSFLKDMEQL